MNARLLTAEDVIRFAISAEESQYEFYSKAAKIVDDDELKATFEFLSQEEMEHKNHLQELLAEAVGFDDSLPEGYSEYLNALLSDISFLGSNHEHLLSNVKTADEALALAINHEAEVLLYYQELKQMVPENEMSIVDKIIAEERKHFTILTTIKRKLLRK